MSIGGLILAAGAGTRFAAGDAGAVKQLADFRGRPLLQWAVDAQCSVHELDRVVVVLGANADLITSRLQLGRAQATVCPDWESGLSASLRSGMRALSEFERVIVTLGDQPLVDADLIRRFVNAPPGTRAAYGGRPGHPVVLGHEHRAAIAQLGGDAGARSLLQGGHLIDCGAHATTDVDTVTDLQDLV